MSAPLPYVAVENSGMVGECDVGRFGTMAAAWAYINRAYTAEERDRTSPKCLFPDVCIEIDGARSYDI